MLQNVDADLAVLINVRVERNNVLEDDVRRPRRVILWKINFQSKHAVLPLCVFGAEDHGSPACDVRVADRRGQGLVSTTAARADVLELAQKAALETGGNSFRHEK